VLHPIARARTAGSRAGTASDGGGELGDLVHWSGHRPRIGKRCGRRRNWGSTLRVCGRKHTERSDNR
jgi:hypothetical protein